MVNDAYQSCENNVYCDFTKCESDMLRYISKLRRDCATGIDGITSEHLAWAKGTKLIGIICDMITICVRYGIVPDTSTNTTP